MNLFLFVIKSKLKLNCNCGAQYEPFSNSFSCIYPQCDVLKTNVACVIDAADQSDIQAYFHVLKNKQKQKSFLCTSDS